MNDTIHLSYYRVEKSKRKNWFDWISSIKQNDFLPELGPLTKINLLEINSGIVQKLENKKGISLRIPFAPKKERRFILNVNRQDEVTMLLITQKDKSYIEIFKYIQGGYLNLLILLHNGALESIIKHHRDLYTTI